jgi:hypothetical protein
MSDYNHPANITLYVRKLSAIEKKKLRKESRSYKPYKYIVTEDFTLTLPTTGDLVYVPRGFLSDGCSGPGHDHWGVKDWIIHDWLYFSGGYAKVNSDLTAFEGNRVSRRQADGVFRRKFFYRRWCVRLFGKRYWNKQHSHRVLRPDLLYSE